MIVVIGNPALRHDGEAPVAEGLASRIAGIAAAAGATVQLVGKVGDDAAGDALLIELARVGVGHAALLRDPAHPTPLAVLDAAAAGEDGVDLEADDPLVVAELLEGPPPASWIGAPAAAAPEARGPGVPSLEAADLELGLRYLVEFRVVVATEPLDERSAVVAADAAGYAGAEVVALVAPGSAAPTALAGATVLEIPPADPDGVFARLVATFAVGLDRGAAPAEAFRDAAAAGGWEAALG